MLLSIYRLYIQIVYYNLFGLVVSGYLVGGPTDSQTTGSGSLWGPTGGMAQPPIDCQTTG